jgi:hypothetical protein
MTTKRTQYRQSDSGLLGRVKRAKGGTTDLKRPIGYRSEDAFVGGDGIVDSFQNGWSPYLTNARIVVIYWGAAWGDPSTKPSADDLTAALTALIESRWGTQLNQDHGIGPMRLESIVKFTTSNPPVSFAESDVQRFVDARICDSTVPNADSLINRVYCVVMPFGHSFKDVGAQSTFHHSINLLLDTGTPVYYAWITNDGTLIGGNSVPKVFSHAVAEAVTDLSLFSGISLTGWWL